jgi:HK97 family phage major capsid protein
MEPIEQVMREIRDDLRQLQARKDALLDGDRRRDNVQQAGRSGSRFAAPGAAGDVLDQLAAGGSIQQPSSDSAVARPDQRAGLALGLKALAAATPSAGGSLVEPEVAADVLVRIRARAVVYRAGARVVPVKKSLAINALSAGATAYYVAENAAIPVSEETFSQDVILSPRELAALVPVSNRLLRDADNPAIEEIVRGDLARIMALRADLAFLRGTGASVEPVGISNTAGLTPAPDLGANGGTPDYDTLMEVVAALRDAGAPFQRPGWIFHPRLLSTLEKLKDNNDRYLLDAGLLTYAPTGATGTLLGFPFWTTTQIPITLTTGTSTDTTDVYFSSDWNEAWVGEEDGFTIEASGEGSYWNGSAWVSAFQNRQTLFRATTAHDIALRQPELFTVLEGVRP